MLWTLSIHTKMHNEHENSMQNNMVAMSVVQNSVAKDSTRLQGPLPDFEDPAATR